MKNLIKCYRQSVFSLFIVCGCTYSGKIANHMDRAIDIADTYSSASRRMLAFPANTTVYSHKFCLDTPAPIVDIQNAYNTSILNVTLYEFIFRITTTPQSYLGYSLRPPLSIDCDTTTDVPSQYLPGNCYNCFIDLKASNVTEDIRWRMLYYVNIDDNFKNLLSAQLNDNVTASFCATADFVDTDPVCDGFPYPRICNFNITEYAIDNSIVFPFYFTVAMNTQVEKLFYNMFFGTNNRWFGIAFGFNNIRPNPMVGDACVWSTGKSGTGAIRLEDYYLNGTAPQNVILNANQYLNLTSSTVTSSTNLYFNRVFDTGDAHYRKFNGTEVGVWVFAATTNIPPNPQLQSHGGLSSLMPAIFLLFVPSPEDSNSYFRTQGTCAFIANDTVIPTADPTTAEPTVSPTTAQPTVSPTTAQPTGSPTENPTTAQPTVSSTTAQPTISPTTAQPTISPTTARPTTSPTTAEPTTAQPTTSPTTAQPTISPTTAQPTTVQPTTSTENPTTAQPTTVSTLLPTVFQTASPSSSPVIVAMEGADSSLDTVLSVSIVVPVAVVLYLCICCCLLFMTRRRPRFYLPL